MLIEQRDESSISKEQHVFDLSRREYAYKMVYDMRISPRELDEDLAIKFDGLKPSNQDEKRAAKLTELDAYKDAYLQAYNELCDIGVARFDMTYLMENGFGLGAGDCLDDESVDALIAKDEEIERAKDGL